MASLAELDTRHREKHAHLFWQVKNVVERIDAAIALNPFNRPRLETLRKKLKGQATRCVSDHDAQMLEHALWLWSDAIDGECLAAVRATEPAAMANARREAA